MKAINNMHLRFPARSVNESFARMAVTAFVSVLDPTVDWITDIKTAVSEAVTNAIVHGYSDTTGLVYISATIYEGGTVVIKIRDKGKGIADIKQAMEPLYTSGDSERSGLGFSVMESTVDKVTVRSKPGKGCTITLKKAMVSKDFSNV